MKILITGITGLIGQHLTDVLLENGINTIRGTYHSSKNITKFLEQNIELRKVDISNKKDIEDITNTCEVVVHAAARVIDYGTKKQFYDAHYHATNFILEDAKKNKVRHFIYISSIGVASGIDRKNIIPDEDTPLIKTGIYYDDAKIDTEQLVKEFCTNNNIAYTIIRPSAVIGVGSVWINEPLKRMKSSLGLKLIDKGKQPACLIDAYNLAEGIYLCISKNVAYNQTYFFMDDWDISWKKYFTDLASFNNHQVKSSIPYFIVYPLASVIEFIFPLFGKVPPITKKSVKATGSNRTVSTLKAQKELGWKSKHTYNDCMQRIKLGLTKLSV